MLHLEIYTTIIYNPDYREILTEQGCFVNMKTTNELLEIIKNQSDIDDFLNKNKQEFIDVTISEYLSEIIDKHALSKSEIIKKSGLDRVYAYQILNGTKTPSRDKLIQMAIGMELSLEEIQKLLKYSGYAPLYPKNRRDSIVIYAIENKLTFIDLNILLDDKNEAVFD